MRSNEDIAEFMIKHNEWRDDFRILRGLLADYIPENKALQRVLIIILEEGIMDVEKSKNLNSVINKFLLILTEDYAIREDQALSAIEIWTRVLGIYDSYVFDGHNKKDLFDQAQDIEKESPPDCSGNKVEHTQDPVLDETIKKLKQMIETYGSEMYRYDLLGRICEGLFLPKYSFVEGEAEYLVQEGLECVNGIHDDNYYIPRYRFLRAQYAKAILLILNGELIEAYDLYRDLSEKMDELAGRINFSGDSLFYLFAVELAIHQIKVLSGIRDESFLGEHDKEIQVFKVLTHETTFEYNGKLCIPTILPIYAHTDKPLYNIVDDKGAYIPALNYGGTHWGICDAWLTVNGDYQIEFLPYNLRDNQVVTNNDICWKIVKKIDRKRLLKHVENNPYRKKEGFISKQVKLYVERNLSEDK